MISSKLLRIIYLTLFVFTPFMGMAANSYAAGTAFTARVSGLDRSVLNMALNAYNKAQAKGAVKQRILTIIDYSKPSTEKRMWVIDLVKQKVLYNLHVSHGKNSGDLMSTRFSNSAGSKASSIGVFVTGESYQGSNGYSLRLDGLERGFNDNARSRAIVIHGADYVSNSFIRRFGRAGLSWGCPAIPKEMASSVINTIRHGSVVFAYYPDRSWLRGSQFAT